MYCTQEQYSSLMNPPSPYLISTAMQYVLCGLYTKAASFKLFLEGQAFLRSYDLAPLLPSISSTSAKHRKTEKERQLADGRGREGGGRGAISYDCKKAWASIYHSILTALQYYLSYLYISTPIFYVILMNKTLFLNINGKDP